MTVEENKNKLKNSNAAEVNKQYGKLKTYAKKGERMKAHAMKQARKRIKIS